MMTLAACRPRQGEPLAWRRGQTRERSSGSRGGRAAAPAAPLHPTGSAHLSLCTSPCRGISQGSLGSGGCLTGCKTLQGCL